MKNNHSHSTENKATQNVSPQALKGSRRIVSFYTLGCKVNQYETDAMGELFKAEGYEIVDSEDYADVYVINTCTVTNLGDRKSRQFIRRARKRNPNALVAVVGCYSQVAPDEIMSIEGVNLVVGTNERKKIVEFLQDLTPVDKVCIVGDIMQVKDFEELELEEMSDRTRAFIKVQEGCNQYCSYCIIPYARGPVRSRLPQNVLNEVHRLVKNGFKEVVLTGIHVASYGKDLEGGDLLQLLKDVHAVDGIERIRLSSLEPRLMTDEFIEGIAAMPKFCPHFHLSLQSGSDTVLKRMNRKYDTAEYLDTVNRIKKVFPKGAFTTDVIVGFPGETDAEFEETLKFVEQVGFHQIHVFKYSPKKGTPAAAMKDQVGGEIKNIRSEALIQKSAQMERAYVQQFVGEEIFVLFESLSEGNLKNKENSHIATLVVDDTILIEGLSDNYMRVKAGGKPGDVGEILKVRVNSIEQGMLNGTIVR